MAPQHRRGRTDPLNSAQERRWLVIRDRLSRALEHRELLPGADLRAALEAERARRIGDGWRVEEVPHYCSFCFADRGTERICIKIERHEPGTAGLGHG
jgi:hypothetical protein